jgi:crotonobetainyl-CoA:carnitine CoA-transferase CaiB-like acyl-CoA transferase
MSEQALADVRVVDIVTSAAGAWCSRLLADVMLSNFAPAFLRSQYNSQKQWRRAEFDLMSGPVPVADGHFALPISRGHFWTHAMQLLGLPDLADDPRWQSGAWVRVRC